MTSIHKQAAAILLSGLLLSAVFTACSSREDGKSAAKTESNAFQPLSKLSFDGEETEKPVSSTAIALTPKGEDLSERENFFLDFAEWYSICTRDISFSHPEQLSEAEKYRIALCLLDYFAEEPLDAVDGLEKNALYDEDEQLFALPLTLVNGCLGKYLDVCISEPAEALEGLYDGDPKYRYDSQRSAFLVPSLSGFGGWRNFGLIDSQFEEGIYTLTLGLYDPGDAEAGATVYEVTQTVRMRVELTGKEPEDFRLLSYEVLENPR